MEVLKSMHALDSGPIPKPEHVLTSPERLVDICLDLLSALIRQVACRWRVLKREFDPYD